jgi:acetyl esterase
MSLNVPSPVTIETVGKPSGGKLSDDMAAMGEKIAAHRAGKDILTPAGMRGYAADTVNACWTAGPALPHVTDIEIAGSDGSLAVRVYRPDESGNEALPAVIWFHGGGILFGDLDSDDGLCRRVAKDANCCVFNVAYRLAPENPFPAAHDDAVTVCRAIMSGDLAISIDRDRIVVVGYSAGGSLTTTALLAGAAEGWSRVVGHVLIVPLLDYTGAYSWAKRTEADKAGVAQYRACYVQDKSLDMADPRLSPFHAPDISSLPPTFILTGELDPLREEAELFGERLANAGVPVQVARVSGVSHIFISMSDDVADAADALQRTVSAISEMVQG